MLLANIALFALSASCHSPQSQVAEQETALASRISEQIFEIENRKGKRISWNSALDLMLRENLELRESRNQIITAQESVNQIYRDLIPGVSLTARLSRALTDFANLEQDDFALNIFSFINLPGVIAVRIRYYSATLSLMRAQWAYEASVREKTIQLHEQFLQQQLLLERTKNLRLSSRFQPKPSLLTALNSTPEALQKEELALTLERQNRTTQANISRLLGSSQSLWNLNTAQLPQWDYVKNPLPIKQPEKFGVLYRQLQALQLEGQRLSKLGVKLRYWPDIRFSVSSPTLLSVNGERRESFDIDQVFGSITTRVELDTRLSIWTQLKQLERSIAIDRERLEQENAILIGQLLTNQKALALNSRQTRLNEIRLKSLRREERSLDPRQNRDQLEKSLALSERRASLLIERAQLESSFWLLDERRWKRLTWEN